MDSEHAKFGKSCWKLRMLRHPLTEKHEARCEMKLFHFCAPQFLSGIKREGLTLGRTPVLNGDGIRLLPNTQWLTINGSFDQPWNGMVNIKYDRTSFRIVVSVPKSHSHKVLTWPQLKEIIGEEHIIPGFDDEEFSDSKSWRIFVGKIPAHWLRQIKAKPGIG